LHMNVPCATNPTLLLKLLTSLRQFIPVVFEV
jgi:hypothetical protein